MVLKWLRDKIIVDVSHDSADVRHAKEWNYFLLILTSIIIINVLSKLGGTNG